MKRKHDTVVLLAGMVLLLTGCSQPAVTADTAGKQPAGGMKQEVQTGKVPDTAIPEGVEMSAGNDTEDPAEHGTQVKPEETLYFVDAYGQEYETVILPDVQKHPYQKEAFVRSKEGLSYRDDTQFTCRYGVDVSYHQGEIDWQAVKGQGIDFAFVRIGYRGCEEGTLNVDAQFFRNIEMAQAAGIDVGVYFFSQAVNEEEAEEEAEFVLRNLEGYRLQLPVVYDPEYIQDMRARTDDVTGEQFTKNTIRFCEMVREAGYEAMVYSNMFWEAFVFDMQALSEYRIWYADYEEQPQTPYRFEFWQYSNTGTVSGISGDTDLDVWMIPAE